MLCSSLRLAAVDTLGKCLSVLQYKSMLRVVSGTLAVGRGCGNLEPTVASAGCDWKSIKQESPGRLA